MADDSIKKIFGKSAEEVLGLKHKSKQDHSKFHSANAFCGYAGPEEMKHYHSLMKKLSDKQVVELSKKLGIRFAGVVETDRDILVGVIEESDREAFYREYHKIKK